MAVSYMGQAQFGIQGYHDELKTPERPPAQGQRNQLYT